MLSIFDVIQIDVSQIKEEFVKSLKGKSASTIITYKRAIEEFEKYSKKHQFENTIEYFEKYKSYLVKSKKMKYYSVSTYLTSLRVFLKFLQSHSYTNLNFAKNIKFPIKRRKLNFHFLNSKQIKQILELISELELIDIRDKIILTLAIYNGLGEKEISEITISNIVNNGKKSYLYLPSTNENILINTFSQKLLFQYLKLRGSYFASDPLFISHSNRTKNKSMTQRGIREILLTKLKLANQKLNLNIKASPLTLKHTAGILMVKDGRSIAEIEKRFNIKLKQTLDKFYKALEEF